MKLRFRYASHLGAALALACAAAGAQAQQLIGYVNTRDAEVTGASDVLNGQAVLTGAAAVTARDHTAAITLGRGGMARVCQTSALHLTENKSAEMAAPLLFSLDRGAIEIETMATPNDAILTPDLRFTVVNAGPLDLRLRVARNGDTCVENRGSSAPTLNLSDPFGETMYQVAAGQHVLFEHGSLHEVVDHEREPCGCPDAQGMALADALLAAGGAPSPAAKTVAVPAAAAAPAVVPAARQAELRTAEQRAAAAAVKAAEDHPFPAAISEGLAPAPAVPQAAVGTTHMQIADTLSYTAQDSGASGSPPAAAAGQKTSAHAAASAGEPSPSSAPPQRRGAWHAVGRFFKRFFGG
ncbi:MAG TPA: hypothetical protein VGU23_02485 [Acidobacteriaceae bacterium]|nr:hypothetical protein [Acidobacteriaceae bacterium]